MDIRSQILVLVGLALEGGATVYAIRQLFYGYYDRIMKSARGDKAIEREEKKKGCVILLLLIVGMALQGASVFF